jgi:Flp pilus assembly protein TadG
VRPPSTCAPTLGQTEKCSTSAQRMTRPLQARRVVTRGRRVVASPWRVAGGSPLLRKATPMKQRGRAAPISRAGRLLRGDNGEQGAVAVEFALVLPLLMALLVGIITAGLSYNKMLGVADGVREGARFGATASNTPAWPADTVRDQAIGLTTLNVSNEPPVVTSAMVCAELVRAPSTLVVRSNACSAAMIADEPATPANVVAGTCLVKVWAQIPIEFNLVLLGSYTPTVKRQSVSLYERGTC